MNRYYFNNKPMSLSAAEFLIFHGSSIFTTLKTMNGLPMLWDRHWQRMKEQASYFGFALPREPQVLDLIQENSQGNPEQKIRILATSKDWALSCEDYQAPSRDIYEGVEICFSHWQIHPQFASFKTGNSLPYMLAAQEAQKAQVYEALLLDQANNIVDGSRTSIMLLVGQRLIALAGGLQGCMREAALDHAKSLGLSIERRLCKREDLRGQLLLANSLIGVVPVGAPRCEFARELVNYFRMV